MNLSPQFRLVSLPLDVPVGSDRWDAGGLNDRPADTGGHAAYGHYHGHLTDWRAMLANAIDRPVFYTNEPKRQLSYEFAGRPSNWYSGLTGAFSDGGIQYGDKRVYGMDPSHFHLSTLFEVVDRFHDPVSTPLGTMPASVVARIAARQLIAQLAGMFRVNGSYVMPDRPVACMLRAVTGALNRDIVSWKRAEDIADLTVFVNYIDKIALPRWIGPRVADSNNYQQSGQWLGVVPNREYAWQMSNGPYWTVCALHDAMKHLGGTTRQTAEIVLYRQCELIEQLHDIDALGCVGISFPTEQCDEIQHNYDWLAPANVHYTSDDYTHWACRPLDIAGVVLGVSTLRTRAQEIAAAHTDQPQWCVTASGHYFAPVEPKL